MPELDDYKSGQNKEWKQVCLVFCYGERTMSKKEAAEAGGQKKWYWAGR